ncbi:MAG TPA: S9 family peptidase [Gemmatimonadaceae bacterium]|nr:S9 family peptidase [Gemmatimonadaceae bacterium]
MAHVPSVFRALGCALVLGSLVIAAPSPAQEQAPSGRVAQPARGRALTIDDYYRVKVVGSPEISPDGRWVAFTVGTRVEATNGETNEVWLGRSDGSASPRRVSATGANSGTVRWSPDGRLRFVGDGKPLNVDPTMPDSVVPGDPSVERGRSGLPGRTVIPSPDGKLTAILRDIAPAKRERTFASDFEKRHEERFKGVQFDWLDFQRDGQPFPVPNRLDPEVSPPQEIVLGTNDGGAEKQLTRLGLRPVGLTWRSDGTRLVFTADSSYRDERKYGASQIFTVTVDGTVRRLTTDADVNYTNARYSPDGRWILYTRQLSTDAVIRRKLNHGGATDLAITPADGGPEKILTADWDYLPAGAQWSPDSRYVYFTGGVGGGNHLFRVSPNGGAVEQVTKGERRINGISFDRDFNRIAYTVGLIESPAEVYSANIDGSDEKLLSHVNDDLTRDVALSRAERLAFRSQDGTPIEGWLLYPYNYRPDAGPYPLVVSSHGGPHAADGYSFDFKNQYFAANGYFVLETNFRSSTGYGEKFLWGTWGAWGTRDGQDVMAGVDYVLGRAPIDRKRVATIGHSYGGFMTNWLITQYPDRFAAAIPGAGIVNWVSDYGTADIARTKETEFYGTPWEDKAREVMIKQSPLTYAGRVKAPTLFINGEVDQRVPYSEAEQMYVALKKNGVPAKVIQYAGMPHSISGSWNQIHRMMNELRWLDKYLKPGKVS